MLLFSPYFCMIFVPTYCLQAFWLRFMKSAFSIMASASCCSFTTVFKNHPYIKRHLILFEFIEQICLYSLWTSSIEFMIRLPMSCHFTMLGCYSNSSRQNSACRSEEILRLFEKTTYWFWKFTTELTSICFKVSDFRSSSLIWSSMIKASQYCWKISEILYFKVSQTISSPKAFNLLFKWLKLKKP